MENKPTKSSKRAKDPNHYPSHLSPQEVQALIAYYENRSDANAIADVAGQRRVAVPTTVRDSPNAHKSECQSFDL